LIKDATINTQIKDSQTTKQKRILLYRPMWLLQCHNPTGTMGTLASQANIRIWVQACGSL